MHWSCACSFRTCSFKHHCFWIYVFLERVSCLGLHLSWTSISWTCFCFVVHWCFFNILFIKCICLSSWASVFFEIVCFRWPWTFLGLVVMTLCFSLNLCLCKPYCCFAFTFVLSSIHTYTEPKNKQRHMCTHTCKHPTYIYMFSYKHTYTHISYVPARISIHTDRLSDWLAEWQKEIGGPLRLQDGGLRRGGQANAPWGLQGLMPWDGPMDPENA